MGVWVLLRCVCVRERYTLLSYLILKIVFTLLNCSETVLQLNGRRFLINNYTCVYRSYVYVAYMRRILFKKLTIHSLKSNGGNHCTYNFIYTFIYTCVHTEILRTRIWWAKSEKYFLSINVPLFCGLKQTEEKHGTWELKLELTLHASLTCRRATRQNGINYFTNEDSR